MVPKIAIPVKKLQSFCHDNLFFVSQTNVTGLF